MRQLNKLTDAFSLCSSAVMSSACGFIILFSVVLYLVRSVHKFFSRLVLSWTPNTWQPVESDSCSEGVMFLTGQICFLHRVSLEIRQPTQTVKVKAVLISQKQYPPQDSQIHSLCCENIKPPKVRTDWLLAHHTMKLCVFLPSAPARACQGQPWEMCRYPTNAVTTRSKHRNCCSMQVSSNS